MAATHTIGAGVPSPQAERKAISTLTAQFALKGFVLDVQRRDGALFFTVSRWGRGRSFGHVHDLTGFLAQIGGAA